MGNSWTVDGPTPSNIPGSTNGNVPPMNDQQRETLVPETSQWTDTRAMQIALADFQKAEAYRTANHDWRFRTSDQMYLAWKQRRTWEGTKIPKSSLGIFIALEQIEALLPNAIGSLFPDNCQLPFDVEPRPSSTVDEANAVRNLLQYQLQDLGDVGKYLTMREITRRGYKSSYIYGNGICEFGVMDRWLTRTRLERINIPVRKMVPHAITGEPVPMPTGEFTSHVRRTLDKERIVKPTMHNIDVRDFYIDPNCSSHNCQDAGYCAVRALLTVNQILEYANVENFNLPPMQGLLALAAKKTTTQGDTSKQQLEAFRGMNWQPTTDYTSDPNLARLELIRYYQRNREVWMLGRSWCAYNQPNQYGLLPFLNAFYVDVPSRFYGLSICDLVEGDQRLAEAIINGRIDELNLMIHPPIIKKQGRAFSGSQQRLRPGVIWDAEDPQNDYRRFEMGNVTQSAYIEVDALERRVQKKTGITDLAVLGTPAAGGNSANRTATGISSQGAASGRRIQYNVENAEDQFLVPALDILLSLNQIFLPMDQMVKVLGPESQFISIDPVEIANASVKFKMNASSKMKTRQALQGGGLAIILQSILNPGLLQLAMQNGVKPIFQQIQRMINDTFGLPEMALFGPMTPEDMQLFQQQMQAENQAKMAMQQARLQAQGEHQDAKDETILLKTLLEKVITPDAAHAMLNDIAGGSLPMSNETNDSSQSGA